MFRRLTLLPAVAGIFLLGFFTARWYLQKTSPTADEKATVLLESIRNVAKLITVEGYFSEIYDYKDYYGYDWSPFRKKALLRVNAKVSVGYDLSEMKIEARPVEKRFIVTELPEPGIISIDHKIDYYDIQEGTFNSFSPEDYNRLQENVRKFIEQKALQSDLMPAAMRQGNLLIETMKTIAESAGWTLQVDVPLTIPAPSPLSK
jgi:hypothetical protein